MPAAPLLVAALTACPQDEVIRVGEFGRSRPLASGDPSPLPRSRTVVQFVYCDLPPSKSHWWLVIEPDGEVDLCWSDPGFEVDLYVTTDLRTMTAIWMGLTTVAREQAKIELSGSRAVAASMQAWLGLSPFAVHRKLVG